MSWTPYAIVSIYRVFINGDEINPILATIPAFIAKTSLVWPALMNATVNRTIYNTFKTRTMSSIQTVTSVSAAL